MPSTRCSAAGFAREDIDILHNEEDLQRLDPTGAAHGFLAQFHRTLIRRLDLEEFKHLTQYVEAVRAGLFVLMVLAKKRGLRITAAEILHQYGADFVEFYGRWSCEDVPATAQTSPGRHSGPVRTGVERARSRRPDGPVRRRCRIRQRRRAGVARPGGVTQVARGPARARVEHLDRRHQRHEGQAAVNGVRRRPRAFDDFGRRAPPVRHTPDPRTTIVSFVVHRAGEQVDVRIGPGHERDRECRDECHERSIGCLGERALTRGAPVRPLNSAPDWIPPFRRILPASRQSTAAAAAAPTPLARRRNEIFLRRVLWSTHPDIS